MTPHDGSRICPVPPETKIVAIQQKGWPRELRAKKRPVPAHWLHWDYIEAYEIAEGPTP